MNNQRYKYWVIYLIDETGEKRLYAYTDRKQLLSGFKQTRNMDKFVIQKMFLTRKDIHTLTYDYNGGYLTTMEGKTQLSNYDIGDFSLVVTKNEMVNVNSWVHTIVMVKIWNYCQLNPYLLKDKYFRALDDIGYVETYEQLIHPEFNHIGDWLSNHEPDYLAGFIRMYGPLLRSDL